MLTSENRVVKFTPRRAKFMENILIGALVPPTYMKGWEEIPRKKAKEIADAIEDIGVILFPYRTRDIAPLICSVMVEMYNRGYKVRWIHPSLNLLFWNPKPTLYVYDSVHNANQEAIAKFIETEGLGHKHILITPYTLTQVLEGLLEATYGD